MELCQNESKEMNPISKICPKVEGELTLERVPTVCSTEEAFSIGSEEDDCRAYQMLRKGLIAKAFPSIRKAITKRKLPQEGVFSALNKKDLKTQTGSILFNKVNIRNYSIAKKQNREKTFPEKI